jgi:hypothetical protein
MTAETVLLCCLCFVYVSVLLFIGLSNNLKLFALYYFDIVCNN